VNRVSVIIPTYNMAHYLNDSINSIVRQTNSACIWEILIIDTGSTDNTEEIINSYDYLKKPIWHQLGESSYKNIIRYIKVDKVYPSKARNIGLKEATGDLIAFLDADDLWVENKLENQLTHLKENPYLLMISGFVQIFDELEQFLGKPSENSFKQNMINVNMGACLFKKRVFDIVGYFDESLEYSEDMDLMYRLHQASCQFEILYNTVLYYRRHAASMTSNKSESMKYDEAKVDALYEYRKKTVVGCNQLDFDLKNYLEPIFK
jgi:glycosyltransferase involved in cell wall biosynthesis